MFAPRSGPYLVAGLGPVVVLVVLQLLRVLGGLPYLILTAALAIVWSFFAWFLRDPERTPGVDVVSAADGHVLSVDVQEGRVRVAVFMNVTDVHVNRFPIEGRVETIEVKGEGFRPAYHADARHNRRCHYRLSTPLGPVEVVQMTGIVARRLVPLVRAGETHPKGERLGMIILGSRVDVILPAERVRVTVVPRDRVRAGRTTIATVLP